MLNVQMWIDVAQLNRTQENEKFRIIENYDSSPKTEFSEIFISSSSSSSVIVTVVVFVRFLTITFSVSLAYYVEYYFACSFFFLSWLYSLCVTLRMVKWYKNNVSIAAMLRVKFHWIRASRRLLSFKQLRLRCQFSTEVLFALEFKPLDCFVQRLFHFTMAKSTFITGKEQRWTKIVCLPFS